MQPRAVAEDVCDRKQREGLLRVVLSISKWGGKKQERGDAREVNLREIRLRTWLLNILYEKREKKKSPQQWHSSAIKPLAQARE